MRPPQAVKDFLRFNIGMLGSTEISVVSLQFDKNMLRPIRHFRPFFP